MQRHVAACRSFINVTQIFSANHLLRRDKFNFAQCARRQIFHGNTTARRFADEIFFVNGIERGKIGDVGKKTRRLENFAEVVARRLKYRAQIFATLSGLPFDIFRDDFSDDGIDCNLSRRVQKSVDFDCLAVRPDSRRSFVRVNDSHEIWHDR